MGLIALFDTINWSHYTIQLVLAFFYLLLAKKFQFQLNKLFLNRPNQTNMQFRCQIGFGSSQVTSHMQLLLRSENSRIMICSREKYTLHLHRVYVSSLSQLVGPTKE